MKQTDLEKLLADMSLKEKVDQMLQLSGAFYLGDENSVLTGPANDMGIGKEDLEMAGSILGAAGADTMKKLQDDYMAKQPHHIPMLFMMDVIHGMKTIFPAPLAQGATFDPELSGECASAAAKEASAAGLHVTFSPMVDLVRDARWGRVVESTGEDPYLNSRFSEAIVKGFQGDDLKTPGKVASCIKHFAGYGGAVAGRDYNTVELSEHTFREFYLPAYKAGIDAGAAMVMTSFNTINGVPASTNKWLMRDILRGEMGFDGVLISDFAAILETVAHRSSKDAADAAKKALEAGVDIDMMTSVYAANLCRLVEEGEVDEHLIDECCLRILELKNKLGLFENPYKDDDSAKLDEMYIGDISDIIQFQQQKRFNSFCISFIIMVLGVVMLLLFIPLTRQKIVGIEFLNLGVTAFVSGLYLTTDGRYLQLVFGDAHIYHVIAETALRLSILPFLIFLSQMYDSYSKRISAILCVIGEIAFAGCFIGEITEIMDYHETLFLVHVVFAISMLFILVSTIKGIVKAPKENIYHNIGCIVLSFMAMTDIIILWRGTGRETSYFIRLGILIFFFMEIVQIIKKFLASYQRNIKNELLSRLAYHDGLTDLLNRTSYMEKVKELEDDENPYMLIAIYDVNNLKKVNDTMGHQKGDEMIKRVADVMSASLGKYGQCYRVGGDEFVFISTKPDIETVFMNASKKMMDNLGCITDGNNIVPITAAMGYAVKNDNSTKDINEIIREADSRMYEKKRSMKHRKA